MSELYQFAAIGEAMIELSHQEERKLALNFAGDTLNVATYLARLSHSSQVKVNYVTALGTDPYSDLMLQEWHKEGIGTEYVARIQDKLPGLYLIRTNPQGERTFYFYRNQSAARELFKNDQTQQLLNNLLKKVNYLYLSLISLAILDEASRTELLALIAQAKQHNITLIFDSNYRASLWPDRKIAQTIYQQLVPYIDILLPTLEDEQQIFQEQSLAESMQRLQQWGIKEIAIKRGSQACLLLSNQKIIEIPAVKAKQIVDTTSAGDSFNAAYLAARMQKLAPEQAVGYGHKLANAVISYPGAIIPREKMPNLFTPSELLC